MEFNYTNINCNSQACGSYWFLQRLFGLLWDMFYHWTFVQVSILN